STGERLPNLFAPAILWTTRPGNGLRRPGTASISSRQSRRRGPVPPAGCRCGTGASGDLPDRGCGAAASGGGGRRPRVPLAQPGEHARGGQRSGRSLVALVLAGGGQPGPNERLVLVIAGLSSEADGDAVV